MTALGCCCDTNYVCRSSNWGCTSADVSTHCKSPCQNGNINSLCGCRGAVPILKLNLLLNTNLNGVPIQDINLGMIARLKEQAGSHSGVVADVLDAVAATIHVDEEDMKVYTSGATNIFKYPELADTSRASELISTFEDKQELADMVREEMGDPENTGVQVYIGDEVPVRTMKDCSVVTATYELGDGMRGTIGIIGPKRMDYENVVDSLKKLKVQLDEMVNKKT